MGKSSDPPLGRAVSQEGAELRSVRVFKDQHQEAVAELKGTRELADDLPHTVQEQEEDGGLLARLAVGEGRLGAALVERVTRLGQMVQEVNYVISYL